jgi:hypothetical protein
MKPLKFTVLTLMLLPLVAAADLEEAEIIPPAETALEPEPVPIAEPAAEPAPVLAPAPEPAVAPALPKPVSMAQMLSGTSLSRSCVEDFTNVLGKSGFSMASFAKELVTSVAKTKLQLKAPFGKPKESDITSAGLSVGCIRTLPESPAEITSMLKDIALKAGLDFAAGATNFAEGSIPANIDTGGDSGGGVFGTVMSVSLITSGLGTLVYGFTQNGEVKDAVNRGRAKAAVDARSSRNMSYGIGAGLLAVGLIVFIAF